MCKGKAKIRIQSICEQKLMILISSEKTCDETSFEKKNLHTSLLLGSTPDRLREAAAAQAAFRSSSTRLKGEPQRRRFYCFQSEQKTTKCRKCRKKCPPLRGKSSPSDLFCQVIFNLLKFQGQVNITMEWQGWINFTQISR